MVARRNFKMIRFGSIIIFRYVPDTSSVSETLNGLTSNRAYIKIRTPNSPCTDNTWFFEYFYGFLGFVVWEISGHFWGVYQSHYFASAVAFLFSFVYVIHLNIASYLYGKQIKSKLWTKLYLWMIFICVRLNRLHFHECRPMPLYLH